MTEKVAELRTYDDSTAARVKALYHTMRCKQSVEHVQRMRRKYTGPGALGFELQGKFDLDGVMANQSLMDYCSPSSNGDIFRDVIDDETTMLDAIAWDDDEGGNVTTTR